MCGFHGFAKMNRRKTRNYISNNRPIANPRKLILAKTSSFKVTIFLVYKAEWQEGRWHGHVQIGSSIDGIKLVHFLNEIPSILCIKNKIPLLNMSTLVGNIDTTRNTLFYKHKVYKHAEAQIFWENNREDNRFIV